MSETNNCSRCKLLEKKIKIYEKLIEEIKDDIDNESQCHYELQYIKNLDGTVDKKITTDFDESFIVIDNGKNINELSKDDRQFVSNQKNLHIYNKTKKIIKKVGVIYSISSFITGFL